MPPGVLQSAVPPVAPPPAELPLVDGTAAGDRVSLRRDAKSKGPHIVQSVGYSFVFGSNGEPEILETRNVTRCYAGTISWLGRSNDYQEDVTIEILCQHASEADKARFDAESRMLARAQGHPNVLKLFASHRQAKDTFPEELRDHVDDRLMIVERTDSTLEDCLRDGKERSPSRDLMAKGIHERVAQALAYLIPVASATEHLHMLLDMCHRDIRPANIRIRDANDSLAGSQLAVRLTGFASAVRLSESPLAKDKSASVTLFSSPEQRDGTWEVSARVEHGTSSMLLLEGIHEHVGPNDQIFVLGDSESYEVADVDRAQGIITLDRPYAGPSRPCVYARITRAVGRPADIYALGTLLYYIIQAGRCDPRAPGEALRDLISHPDPNVSIKSYLASQYETVRAALAGRARLEETLTPADPLFRFRYLFDDRGALIPPAAMLLVARCVVRNKADSYCQSHEVKTHAISAVVRDLVRLQDAVRAAPPEPVSPPTQLAVSTPSPLVAPEQESDPTLPTSWIDRVKRHLGFQ